MLQLKKKKKRLLFMGLFFTLLQFPSTMPLTSTTPWLNTYLLFKTQVINIEFNVVRMICHHGGSIVILSTSLKKGYRWTASPSWPRVWGWLWLTGFTPDALQAHLSTHNLALVHLGPTPWLHLPLHYLFFPYHKWPQQFKYSTSTERREMGRVSS